MSKNRLDRADYNAGHDTPGTAEASEVTEATEATEAISLLGATIRARRSIRRYGERSVPRPIIEALLMTATWAPSAHNRQPWRFAPVLDGDMRQRLARAMGEQLRADLAADHAPPDVIDKDAGRSYTRITAAPVLIVVCLSMADMDSYPDPKRAAAEYVMAVQSTAMAVQNLLLTAHSYGLGACWMCAPLFCPEVVRGTLDLPSDWQPQALITLGYPAEHKEKPRQPLETKILWR